MSKLGILGATALSLALAVASPALAAGRGGGGGGGGHIGGGGGGGMHFSGGGGGGMRVGAAPMGGAAAFRGAQASIGPGRTAPVNSGNFAGRTSPQFAQGGFRDRDHDRFGRGVGFIGGLGYGYDPYYYGDDYAYDDGNYDDTYAAYPGYVAPGAGYEVSSAADPAYCAQRYRSWDPASGTYLGFDGLRHPCGQ